jgi:uncharacterized protein YukE
VSYTAGEIKVNHAGMASCVQSLDASVAGFASIKDKLSVSIEDASSAWSGSAGGAFAEVAGANLDLQDLVKSELSAISSGLAATDEAFSEADAAVAGAVGGVG